MSDPYGGAGKPGAQNDPTGKPGEFSDDPDYREDKTESGPGQVTLPPGSGDTCQVTCPAPHDGDKR